jgi:hypothetical protein
MSDTPSQPSTPGSWLSDLLGGFLQGSRDFSTPDVTKVQALALAQAFIAVLIVLGVDLDDDLKQTIIALAAVIGAVLPISDVAIRRSRAQHAASIASAQQTASAQAATHELASVQDREALANAELELQRARLAAAKALAEESARTP